MERSPEAPASDIEFQKTAEIRYPGPGKLLIIWTVVGILSSLRFQFQRPPNPEIGQLAFTLAYSACYYPWIAFTPLVFRSLQNISVMTKQDPQTASRMLTRLGDLLRGGARLKTGRQYS